MASISIWPGSASFSDTANPTPFGFYDNDIEKASLYAEKLRKSFIAQGHFKNVEISKGKVLKRSRTGFKITILL